MLIVERSDQNPIFRPDRRQSWEGEAVFNGCPAEYRGKTYLLYRALSLPHYHSFAGMRMMISDIGIAESKDGLHFAKRRRFIVPENEWERFGCEDPRVTRFGNTFYIFYTALSKYPFEASGIKVGLAKSRDLKTVTEKHLITPFNAKGMALFPEHIGGKMWAVLTAHTDSPPAKICLASFKKESDMWSEKYWDDWHKNIDKSWLNLQRGPDDQVEVGSPPVKTKYGWLLVYAHIRDYRSSQKIFGIEAILLDLKNPFKILARTRNPILVPEEFYEKYGMVPNIAFPSGAILKGDTLRLYYGSADTTCSLAYVNLPSLVKVMREDDKKTAQFARARVNPILQPDENHAWENKAVFNPAAIDLGGKVHIIYRAQSEDNTSVFGYASSRDGLSIDYRAPEPIYVPRESFEQKINAGGFSGCEDPRLTRMGGRIYMCYTAYDGVNPPRVAFTSISTSDFLQRNWRWERPVLLTPPGCDDKDAFLFPEKIRGKYAVIHRGSGDIDVGFISNLKQAGKTWLEEYRWIDVRKGSWDSRKVGAAAPPLKTRAGWIMLYHGVSDTGTYRVGAVLLDLKDPLKIIGRTTHPVFEPEASYEKEGLVPKVVFPCGAVIRGKKIYMYYGGGDKVTGVAVLEVDKLLGILK